MSHELEEEDYQEPVRRRRSGAANIREEDGVGTKGSITKDRGEPLDERTSDIAIPTGEELPDHPGGVTIGARATYNLGNYESLQVYASVSMPCAPTREGYLTAKRRAAKLVAEFIEEERRSHMDGQ